MLYILVPSAFLNKSHPIFGYTVVEKEGKRIVDHGRLKS
jgi:hypothetical protein